MWCYFSCIIFVVSLRKGSCCAIEIYICIWSVLHRNKESLCKSCCSCCCCFPKMGLLHIILPLLPCQTSNFRGIECVALKYNLFLVLYEILCDCSVVYSTALPVDCATAASLLHISCRAENQEAPVHEFPLYRSLKVPCRSSSNLTKIWPFL